MKTLYLVLTFLLLCGKYLSAQVNPNKDRQVVLKYNIVGKIYIFERSKGNTFNRTEISYLGKVKTADNRVFKVLISRWYWGLSPRATSRIAIYNTQNQYLGNYYVTMTYDLPAKIQDNYLIFTNKGKDKCDSKLITKVSFKHGLPKQFFLKCKENLGDIYSFGDE